MYNMTGISLCQLAAVTLVLLFIMFPTFEATKEAKVKLGAGQIPVSETNEGMWKDVSKRHFF